jgi:DNA-binding CsgD family transcriptional regulator
VPGRFNRSSPTPDRLTPLEGRALELFASGHDRNEIAQLMHRAPKTISNCLTLAKDKLGARSLAQAAVLFIGTLPINQTSGL